MVCDDEAAAGDGSSGPSGNRYGGGIGGRMGAETEVSSAHLTRPSAAHYVAARFALEPRRTRLVAILPGSRPPVRDAVQDALERNANFKRLAAARSHAAADGVASLREAAQAGDLWATHQIGIESDNPAELRRWLRDAAHGGFRPDLLITDVVMPGISGSILAERLRRTRPRLAVLDISGYTDSALPHHGVLDPNTPFLQKPFHSRELGAKVREILTGELAKEPGDSFLTTEDMAGRKTA